MAGSGEPSTSASSAGGSGDKPASGSFKHIGNKMKRTELYRKYKAEKRKAKFARRSAQAKEERGEDGAAKKAARLAANKTRTIENTRDFNPTIINAPNTHEGPGPSNLKKTSGNKGDDAEEGDDSDEEQMVEEEQEAAEEIDQDEDPSAPPAILITTSMPSSSTSPHLESLNARSHPSERTREFVDELLSVFPGAEYRSRSKAQGVGLGKICGWARQRRYDALLVVNESRKQPFALTVISLPHGPTAFFRLTSISTGAEIYGKARPTPHTPELILNNFTTVLGHRVGKVLQNLFPKIPQLEGRQVVTCHNQRDYIFFRRHRYMFKSDQKTALQEIGPRFTLKLHSLKESLPKGAGVWDGKYSEEYAELEPEELEALQRQADGTRDDQEEAAAAAVEQEDAMQQDAQVQTSSSAKTAKKATETSNKKKRQRGEEETTGLDFQWKPKMSVSRRNFYL
ncbi:related to RPF1 - involved in the assembly of the large ribosomal subunit [Ustilago trichophora]|uniref:Related to RPF1 - involved in the assembly of the large ribosomal subunit n=1 Tax=Ustilago trichophora TaxID=86804 RepID=A0A5C3DNR6_9BASI|nr:related to RPF1 - involved in the assembly of the large ribosomal subunit [Ustilago trichophora]